MVDRHLAAAKLAELAERIQRARSRCPASAAELAGDRDALDFVSFNLMLAVQGCADIASHLIADEGWPAAPNLAGSSRRSLRNGAAHGYAGINPAMVHAAATRGIGDLEAFAQEVARWIAAHP